MSITAAAVLNKNYSLGEPTHSQQFYIIMHETGNEINYSEWLMIDNDDNEN